MIVQADYFFPVFLVVFLADFFVVFFSSFFCRAFTEATFFTIFCSSIRKARRMLFTNLHFRHSTGHGRICGTDFHHKHELQNAGVRTVFSYYDQRYEESSSINEQYSYTSKRLLAATAFHRANNFLVVLNNKSSTYSSFILPNWYQGSSQYGTCLTQYCRSVCGDR